MKWQTRQTDLMDGRRGKNQEFLAIYILEYKKRVRNRKERDVEWNKKNRLEIFEEEEQ